MYSMGDSYYFTITRNGRLKSYDSIPFDEMRKLPKVRISSGKRLEDPENSDFLSELSNNEINEYHEILAKEKIPWNMSS